MPLTPADVHNVAFSKPPIGKRGYNEDEVDAFLDLVETELSRLLEENADLSQRVVLDTGALAWSPSPMAGVERRRVDRCSVMGAARSW
jgi:DivIVA domain-containing protein